MDLSSSGKVAMDELGLLMYVNYENCLLLLLNQAHAGCRTAHAWFLKIDPVQIVGMRVRVCACVCVCVCVCVCPRARGY